mmetsp:Transcript_27889/g.80891  ORF Transcript_27889/g.80891 Transcript_27889/m.80891 type:complete len:301 (+) Transcript_27889:218-1120(+)
MIMCSTFATIWKPTMALPGTTKNEYAFASAGIGLPLEYTGDSRPVFVVNLKVHVALLVAIPLTLVRYSPFSNENSLDVTVPDSPNKWTSLLVNQNVMDLITSWPMRTFALVTMRFVPSSSAFHGSGLRSTSLRPVLAHSSKSLRCASVKLLSTTSIQRSATPREANMSWHTAKCVLALRGPSLGASHRGSRSLGGLAMNQATSCFSLSPMSRMLCCFSSAMLASAIKRQLFRTGLANAATQLSLMVEVSARNPEPPDALPHSAAKSTAAAANCAAPQAHTARARSLWRNMPLSHWCLRCR